MAQQPSTSRILLGQLAPVQPTTTSRYLKASPFAKLGARIAPPKGATPPINPDVDSALAAAGLTTAISLAPKPTLHLPPVMQGAPGLEVLNVARTGISVSRPHGEVDDAGRGTTSPNEYSRAIDDQVGKALPPANKLTVVQMGLGAALALWLVTKAMD